MCTSHSPSPFPSLSVSFSLAERDMADQRLPAPTQSPSFNAPNTDQVEPHEQPLHDFNVIIIVAAMLCALLCALGLNSMLQCVLQCAHRMFTEPLEWVASRTLNSGLKKKEMGALPTTIYATSGHSSPTSNNSSSGCAICLVDFTDGDKIRLMPQCNHRFHTVCIDQWLLSHSSCPTCRHQLKSHNSSVPPLEIVIVS